MQAVIILQHLERQLRRLYRVEGFTIGIENDAWQMRLIETSMGVNAPGGIIHPAQHTVLQCAGIFDRIEQALQARVLKQNLRGIKRTVQQVWPLPGIPWPDHKHIANAICPFYVRRVLESQWPDDDVLAIHLSACRIGLHDRCHIAIAELADPHLRLYLQLQGQ
ncbi:hypothetical protein D3C75_1038520 [compost metagenome]